MNGDPQRRKFKAEERPQPSPTVPSLSAFDAAVSKVAVAQICLSAGYTAAEPSALRALSDISARYLQALGFAAASVAAAHRRTESNLLDLVRAIEDLSAATGFPGGSDPAGQPLRSGALRELKEFVGSVEEIPFAKPIPLEGQGKAHRETWRSYAAAGREPPFRHVPRWLPCFPEEPVDGGKKETEIEIAIRSSMEEEEGKTAVELPAEREKVRFRLGVGKGSSALCDGKD
ncbi:hypothetical protein ZIOFF_041766 [Zingiber officinale]|uniref:Bromodomain associated domain-containing protein n=1 Tax=Zingiber officinale TaxID=94328 RepID=A0A8J5L1S6_ZINOF|nr:hypothetical protein ZIOFF_041766 [Zingiber officinale]